MWLGLLVGLIGTAVGVYFGLASRRKRELRFSVNLIRTTVVTSGQATDLKVLYKDEPLGDVDITAVQLAIWNAGKESIEKSDILGETPVTIITNPAVRILEAIVRNQTRERVVRFTLLDSPDSKAEGRLPISWDILERNDGASIQFIYLGNQNVDVLVEGVVKGLVPIKSTTLSSRFKSPQEHIRTRQKQVITVSISFLVLLVTAILRFVVNLQSDIVIMLFIVAAFCLFATLLALLSNIRERFPPFGF